MGAGTSIIIHTIHHRCSSLASVVFPDALQTIGYSAFSGCSCLASLSLPAWTGIAGSAFLPECEIVRVLKKQRAKSKERTGKFKKKKICNSIATMMAGVAFQLNYPYLPTQTRRIYLVTVDYPYQVAYRTGYRTLVQPDISNRALRISQFKLPKSELQRKK